VKLRLQTHTQCILFCKWIAADLSIPFKKAGYSLESNVELKGIVKQ